MVDERDEKPPLRARPGGVFFAKRLRSLRM
jgi:hypothetical protein